MTFVLRLRPEAEQDLLDAATWYEQRRESLGHQFLDEAVASLGAIGKAPSMYPQVYRNVRRALLRRFPFGIFYKVEGSAITVLAVMHASRDPRRWKGRNSRRVD